LTRPLHDHRPASAFADDSLPGYAGCLALADFYEGIATDRRPWAEWLSRHPFPERRIDAVVKVCEEEQRRAR